MLDFRLEENQLLWAILTFQILEYLWEFYLARRQHSVYCTKVSVPTELKGILNEETYSKARTYALDKSNFSMIKGLFSIVVGTAFVLLNGFSIFWTQGKMVLVKVGLNPESEVQVSMAFMLVLNALTTVIGMPFAVYSTFVLEERHGFNKQTPGFFIKDQIKSFLVGQVITLPLVASIVAIVHWGGQFFFVYLWAFTTLVILFLMTIYPDFIAPLFDKYTPLPEGELRTSIEALAKSINFPLYKLYVVEGSKRSVHSNAYFYGFFKNKRIVLFDTLLKDYTSEDKKDEIPAEGTEKKGCSNEEVLAVLAHELGHWQLNHVAKNIIIMQVNLFLMFAAFGFFSQYEPMYRAFGFESEKPVLVGMVIVLQYIFSPYNAVLGCILTCLSRRFEFQADAFAVQMKKGRELCDALIKLNKDNLSFPQNDWLYSAWHHSHPPLLERMAAIKRSTKSKST
ncbi:CAAX prenyl protease 1 homolog [Neocloeon triangulifer]|uniref:CAAX prenyl protease 1 homolog n=1 Tax=Neocloeon triangulifer TaxID=2078957 RepID=UPI00286F6601|nr:CAAX prenyl protease 1 homolog [Neocloeon triangulifer]